MEETLQEEEDDMKDIEIFLKSVEEKMDAIRNELYIGVEETGVETLTELWIDDWLEPVQTKVEEEVCIILYCIVLYCTV